MDLSAFLEIGENKIEISQDRGMAEYTLVIFVHAPTRKQLESVALKRRKDQEWAMFLRDLVKPFILDPTPCPWESLSV